MKKLIVIFAIFIFPTNRANAQSLGKGAVTFTNEIGDFYLNASGDLAIDYVFYDNQPEVKLRWNWFKINYVSYKGVDYSAQNNQIDPSFFDIKRKDFYADVRIFQNIPTIKGRMLEKTKEIYAGTVNTSLTFKVNQTIWTSLSSKEKSDRKKEWEKNISPSVIELLSIKGPVIDDLFRAIKKHASKQGDKKKKIKDLNFKFAALKSRFESSKKNLTVPSIRLESFNKYLKEAKLLLNSLNSLDKQQAYKVKSFIENKLNKSINSTKREIKRKELKKKAKEAEKEAKKKKIEENTRIKKVEKRLTTQQRLEKNYTNLNKKMNNLSSSISSSIINSSRQEQKERFAREQQKFNKKKQREADHKNYFLYARGVWQEYAKVTNDYIKFLKLYSDSSESLSLKTALANARKNNETFIYVVFINAGRIYHMYNKGDNRVQYYYTKPIKVPVKQLESLGPNAYDILYKKANKESKNYGEWLNGYKIAIKHLLFSGNKDYLIKMTNYFYDNISIKKRKVKNGYLYNWTNKDLIE